MKRLWLAIMLALAIVAPSGVALASDISGALYYGIITVSNNGTGAATDTIVTCNISSSDMVTGGYMNSGASNIAWRSSSGSDVAFMPGVGANPWVFWQSDIGGNSYGTNLFYTATSTDGKIRYFPDTAGMASTDNASLELGDNFTIEQRGWVDTDNNTSKYFVSKTDAFSSYVNPSVSGNITADIHANSSDATQDSAVLLYNGGPTRQAQKLSSLPSLITYVSISMAKLGSPTGTLTVNLRKVADDAVIVTIGTKDVSAVTTGQVVYSWSGEWTNPYLGTAVYLSFEYGGGDVSNRIIVGVDASGTGKTYSTYSGSWSDTADQSLTYAINASARASATGLSSGERTITTVSDGTFLSVFPADSRTAVTPSTTNLVLNLPYWSNVIGGASFPSVDANKITTTVVGPTWSASGRTFPGTDANNYISTANNTAINSQTELTWGVWIYATGNADRFIDKGQKGLRIESGKLRGYFYQTGGGTNASSIVTDSLPLNQWVRVDLTYSDSGDRKIWIWVNGVKVTSYSSQIALVGTLYSDPTANFIVGTAPGYTNHYAGMIGEVQVYNAVLSEATILANYNATKWKYDGSTDNYTYVPSAAVSNNANNYAFLLNGVMPYMEYHKIWVGGNLVQSITYEYDTSFYDASGNGNTATPTFRTTGSNANVNATMASFLPVAEAKAPSSSVSGNTTWFSNPTVTGNFTAGLPGTTSTGNPPGYDVVIAIAAATGTPPQLPLLINSLLAILMVSLLLTWFLRQMQSGSVLVKILFITVAMSVCVAIRNEAGQPIYDPWMVVFFLIPAIAFAIAKEKGIV